MKRLGVYVPDPIFEDINTLIKKGRYPNISECIRIAIRDLVQTEFMLLSIKEKGDNNND